MDEFLQNEFSQAGIEVSEDQADKLIRYRDRILEINEQVNLTSIRDPEEFIRRHYVDSAAVLKFQEFKRAKNVIDLGTGAGFPGIPLAVLCPDKHFVLADSLRKRLLVIDQICEEIGISNVETIHARAEDLGRSDEFREFFDVCVSRAVARLPVLEEYCIPLIRKGGYFLSYKGDNVEEELKEAKHPAALLGGKIVRVEDVPADGFRHTIIVVKKEKNTPKKYPRNAGTPSKTPLR